MEKGLRSPVNRDIQKPSTASQNGFGEKIQIQQSTWQRWCLVLVPWPYSSCRSIAFRAVAIFLCRGIVLRAVASLFMPRPFSFFHGVVLRAAALSYVPRRCATCRGIILRAAAMLFVPRQGCGFCGIVLCVAAKNDVPQRCTAFRAVVSLCRGKKRPAAAFRGRSRRSAALFFMLRPDFFVPRQEMTHRSILRRLFSFRSKKRSAPVIRGIAHHVAAWCVMPWCCLLCRGHVLSSCYCKDLLGKNNQPVWHYSNDLGKNQTINLCGIGCHDGVMAVVLPLVVVVFFCGGFCFVVVFFWGGGQSKREHLSQFPQKNLQ